jgi:hypothetical protein
MSSRQESTAPLITFTGVGGSAGVAKFSFEVNLDPESGVSNYLHLTMLKCNLHHDFRCHEPPETSRVRNRKNRSKSMGKCHTQHVLPGIVRPKSAQRGPASVGCPFARSVCRKRIHTLFPSRVGWIRSIQTPHISDHLVKFAVVLVSESRFLFDSKWRTLGRDAR